MARIRGQRSVKRTYTLNPDTLYRFESLVPAGQRSEVIEKLLLRELDEIRRERLRLAIVEGLADMADVSSEVAKDWSVTESEGWPKE
jgi:hypothetical protein